MTPPTEAPDNGLGGSSDALAARLTETCSDLILVIDQQGVIEKVSLGEGVRPHVGWSALVGQRWADTVATSGRGEVVQLLREAADGRTRRARVLNQVVERLGEIPFRFAGVALDAGRVVLLGRDLRPLIELKGQMVSAQQSMEDAYVRLRQADARYRALFHVCGEGVLVVGVVNRRILDANPAAASLLGASPAEVAGRTLDEVFAFDDRALQHMLAAMEVGDERERRLVLRDQPELGFAAKASLLLQSGTKLLLLRFWPDGAMAPAELRSVRMLAPIESMHEGFVVTDDRGDIQCANAGFCELIQRPTEDQLVGRSLGRWLGQPGVDLDIMLENLHEHGVLRAFATVVRNDFQAPQDVVVTATSTLAAGAPCLGFTIRPVSSRVEAMSTTTPRPADQVRQLVGRVSLKEIVRESSDVVERACIETALEMTGNNRAAAAQVLGLSRQGLYSKLRRHKIAEFQSAE